MIIEERINPYTKFTIYCKVYTVYILYIYNICAVGKNLFLDNKTPFFFLLYVCYYVHFSLNIQHIVDS